MTDFNSIRTASTSSSVGQQKSHIGSTSDNRQGKSIRSSKTLQFVAGGFAGSVVALCLQPLDVLRTQQQGTFQTSQVSLSQAFQKVLASNTTPTLANPPTPSLYNTPRRLDAIRGLWRGTQPTIIRVCSGAGIYFVVLNHIINAKGDNEKLSGMRSFLSGAFARTFAGILVTPLTVLKTRMEWAKSGTYTSLFDAFRKISAVEGMGVFYRGIIPTMIRDAPFSGLYVLFYTKLQHLFEKVKPPDSNIPFPLVNFLCGGSAGLIATLITHPADVVKTRVQLTSTESVGGMSTLRVITRLAREEGYQGFLRGIYPRLLKRTLSTALTWTIYEQLAEFYRTYHIE